MTQSDHLTDDVSLSTLIDERIAPVAQALAAASREGETEALRSLMRELAIAVNAASLLLDDDPPSPDASAADRPPPR